ncbi:MAG TPA: flagellar hook-basal body complex protein [Candidatus Limnocylindria bacterium]|jgi:flagellar hook protein FlgE|nr:flagellar hook-basal body complex protein [Candidatus Limnocylindria bacterium]
MPLDSMFIGVSGLEAFQNQIDVVSNNIANVGTTGYKGQNVNFQDLFYQAQSYATAPSQTTGGVNGQQVGLGVKIGSIDTDWTQGGLQTTGMNTNLALNGNGFFILRQPNGNSQPVYTRNGDFQLNTNGLLYDPSSGMAVQGYMASNGVVNQSGTPGDINIPLGLASQAVGTGFNTQEKFGPTGDQVFDMSMGNNVDQQQWIKEAQGVESGTPGTGQAYTTQTTIYDSLGVGHLATITYTPDATGASIATAATGTITSNNAMGSGADPIATIANNPGPTIATTITATVSGGNVTVKDAAGNTQTFNNAAGTTQTFDGVSITFGAFSNTDSGSATISTIGTTSNGLPSQVANASGQMETPASRWKVSVSFDDGTQFSAITNPDATAGGPPPTVSAPTFGNASSGVVGYAYFDQNGQFINTSSLIGAQGAALGGSLTSADVHTSGTPASGTDGNQLNIVAWGTGDTNNSVAPTAGGSPATGPIGLDFSGMTSLAATADAKVLNQNGFGAGTLDNITIGADGTITGAFTNGQTEVLGRVAVATFANQDGLARVGGSDFQQTANSGLAQVGSADTGAYGQIVSGSLEQSNVSIADEFAKMISAQNAYQANSKSITVASEDMQTVTGLIR